MPGARVRTGRLEILPPIQKNIIMIATLRQHALQIAMILVCGAALYLAYRDMKKIDARLNRLDAAVVVLAEEQHATELYPHAHEEILPDFETELVTEFQAAIDAEADNDEPVDEPVAEPAAEPADEPANEPAAVAEA